MESQENDQGSHTKPRHPWLAFLGNFVAPPLGHVYAGAPLRGVVVLALTGPAAIAVSLLLIRMDVPTPVRLGLLVLLIGLTYFTVGDAYDVAKRGGRAYVLRRYNRWFVYVGVLIVVWSVQPFMQAGIRRWVQSFKVPSGAMEPTLQIGDQFLVDKAVYRDQGPNRFDVIVFDWPKDPTKTFIKRVVGLPGETIEVKDGRVWVDGKQLEEPYAYYNGRPTEKGDVGPTVVPEESYFVMGDNRNQSLDSRFWGPVPGAMVGGRAGIIYWSWKRTVPYVRWERLGARIQ